MQAKCRSWEKILITGLTSKDGSPYEISISAPVVQNGTFSCHLNIPSIISSDIFGENALSTLISALRVIEAQIYEPSESIVLSTTLTEEDYPDVEIKVLVEN